MGGKSDGYHHQAGKRSGIVTILFMAKHQPAMQNRQSSAKPQVPIRAVFYMPSCCSAMIPIHGFVYLTNPTP